MTPDSPIIEADFTGLLELLDRDTMREIVAIFVDSCPERLVTARDGIARADLAAVATVFHTMRSGCGQLGARRLEEFCAAGERSAKAGRRDELPDLLAQIERELTRCVGWFRDGGWLGT